MQYIDFSVCAVFLNILFLNIEVVTICMEHI